VSVQHWPGAVLVTGPALRAAADAILIAARARRLSGLPSSTLHAELAAAFINAASANGHTDVRETATPPTLQPTVTVEEAATQMKLSRRQVRRLAPLLGGRIIAGRWLLDQTAIDQHLEEHHG